MGKTARAVFSGHSEAGSAKFYAAGIRPALRWLKFTSHGVRWIWRACLSPKAPYSAIFQIALLSVTKRQSNTHGHKSNWRDYQHQDTFADGLLALLGGGRGRAAAHGTTLAKRGSGPQQERQDEKRGANFHFTPRYRMRKASGKKKMVIKIRHMTTEVIVSHFMRDTSYFRSITKPMIGAALISDNPIRT